MRLTMPQSLLFLAPAFDPAATAYFAAVASAGGTITAPRKTIYNNLFLALRAISPTLSNFNRLFVYAAQDQIAALIDLIHLAQATLTLTPTFTIDRGYTTNGVDNDVNTGYDPTTSSPATLLNSCFLATYTNALGASNASGVGTPAGTFPQMEMVCPFTDGDFHAQINDSGFGGTPATTGAVTGMWIADRQDATNVVLSRNGVDLVTSVDAAIGVPTGNTIRVGAANPVASQSRYAIMATGPSLGANRAAFASAITTFLTAIGAN